MVIEVLIFLVGLTLLYFGAEWLVGGSSAFALRLGITPLIVGCTVVAFGTSAPELVVSLAAVYTESDGISVGNIIGSNIANLMLILGAAAVIRPMKVQSAVIRLTRRETQQLNCDESLFRQVVKIAFSQRRKMLRNTMKTFIKGDPLLKESLFSKRPEKLSVEDFVQLTKQIEQRIEP